jgi:hypothetical protein
MKKIHIIFLVFICMVYFGCSSSKKTTTEPKVDLKQQLEDVKKQAEKKEEALHELRKEDRDLDKELK